MSDNEKNNEEPQVKVFDNIEDVQAFLESLTGGGEVEPQCPKFADDLSDYPAMPDDLKEQFARMEDFEAIEFAVNAAVQTEMAYGTPDAVEFAAKLVARALIHELGFKR